MKRLRIIPLAMILALLPFLQSCLEESKVDYPWLAISTVRTVENVDNGYYLALDNGSTMYPGDTTFVHGYPIVDGQRAFVYFNYLDEPKAGYDYNIKVGQIINILTKDIVDLTGENADKIGDDPINILDQWVSQGYLNIKYQLLGTRNTNKKHFLNLVQNKISGNGKEDGYISLEFRHNAEGDVPTNIQEGYVSFKLNKIAEEMKTAKGLKIRLNAINNDEKFIKIELKK
ncbi:MAG: NigD-like protein [Bacteroides sp.]